jgi:hypothetical protein
MRKSMEVNQRLKEASRNVRSLRQKIRDEEVWQTALAWVMGDDGAEEVQEESPEEESEETTSE